MSLKRYAKIKLRSVYPLYSQDMFFIFSIYDRQMKESIMAFNRAVHLASESNREKELVLTDFQKRDLFQYFASKISYKLPGTVPYNKHYYHRLRTIMLNEELVNGKAHPDLFITITLNEGEVALLAQIRDWAKVTTDDPVRVNDYFFKREKRLNKAIYGTGGKAGIFGKVTSSFCRIEYQDRGAPHAHILLYLDEEGTKRLDDGVMISAEIPRKRHDPELKALVRKYQIHECKNDVCLVFWRNNMCRMGYPQRMVETDQLSEDQTRWLYRRRNKRDRRVVAFNATLLKLCQSNINVQRLTSKGILWYICSYLAKVEPGFHLGEKQKKLSEVKMYLLVRNVSLMEACAIIFGNRHYETKPTIEYLNLSLPMERLKLLKTQFELENFTRVREVLIKQGLLDSTDIGSVYKKGFYEVYYERPEALEDITFLEFRKKWKYLPKDFDDLQKTIKKIPKRCQKEDEDKYLETKFYFFYKRKTGILLTYYHPLVNDGELYFYHKLIEKYPHRAANSENSLLSKGNKRHSFLEEWIMRSDWAEEEADEFAESVEHTWKKSAPTREFLKQIMLERLKSPGQLSETSIDWLTSFTNRIDRFEENRRKGFSFHTADTRLGGDKKDIYNIFKAKGFKADRDIIINPETIFLGITDLYKTISPNFLTGSQEFILDYITEHAGPNADRQVLLFITGGAGSGKTFLLNIIYKLFECIHKRNVKATAMTASAAKIFNGKTVHSQFSVNEDFNNQKIITRLQPGKTLQKLIQNYQLVIVDEVSMMSQTIYDQLDFVCRHTSLDIYLNDKIFGGKSIIFFGDFHQLPPVKNIRDPIRGHGTLSTCNHFLENFTWLFLNENCRQSEDKVYGDLLARCRKGQMTAEDNVLLEQRKITIEKDVDDLVDRTDIQIITPTNKRRRYYNIRKMNLIKGDYIKLIATTYMQVIYIYIYI